MNYLIIATGSFLFCTKGVFAKLCYHEGLDTLDLMFLRMMIALPFFIGLTIVGSRGKPALLKKEWTALIAFGFSGYYLTSYLDFKGLEYIQVGLERMIMFTYPLIILIISRFTKARNSITKRQWIAALLVWIGLAIAFSSYQPSNGYNRNTFTGSLLVFASALLFAIYTINSKPWISRVGVARFTGTVMSVSAICVLIHMGLVKGLNNSLEYPTKVYTYGALIAILGTFLPSILTVMGIQRTSPQTSAIIGSIGPLASLLLASTILDEKITTLLGIGFAISLIGTILIQRKN